MVANSEKRLLELLRIEIATQKKFEGDVDSDIPEGLQTLKVNDILLIE
jgi:hypothetical protein